MLKRQLVLVAIDEATNLERTMDVALSTAHARNAEIHVVRVVRHRAEYVDDGRGLSTLEEHNDRGLAINARLASILRAADGRTVALRRATVRGAPEEVIPAYAQLHQASLLVLEGDYGSSPFWRNGSVVDELARRSPVPLLVLPKRPRRGRKSSAIDRILTPVDFSVASAVALRTAKDLSDRHGARVTLLHAINDVPKHTVFSGGGAWQVVRRLPAQMEALAEQLRRKAASIGVNGADTEVTTGVAARAILATASRSDADMVVMGITPRAWLDRALFGSTLRRVLRKATVPVLVVPVIGGAHTWSSEFGLEGSRDPIRIDSVDRVAA